MMVFVDTSALLAVMVPSDVNHARAARLWKQIITAQAFLITTNYVVLETIALLQRRFGISLVRSFQERIGSYFEVVWIDELLHQAGMAALLVANRRQLSLVDCVSFEVARRWVVDATFAFDEHFAQQGFPIYGAT